MSVTVKHSSQRIASYVCGPCGHRVASALHADTRKRIQIERADDASGDLAVQLKLFEQPGELPLVHPSRGGSYREHSCPSARSFSAANLNRKKKPS